MTMNLQDDRDERGRQRVWSVDKQASNETL
jgi:hypothetical protein